MPRRTVIEYFHIINVEILKRNRENDLSHVTELTKGRATSGPFVPDSLKLKVSNSETKPPRARNSAMKPCSYASSPGNYFL